MTRGLFKEIAHSRPMDVRLMGMDIGKKTIGLAVCDPSHSLATPLETIQRTKFTKDIQRLKSIIAEYEVGGFVLGLPLNVDGTEGPRCQAVRDFAAEMRNHPDVFGAEPWIAFQDERFSTLSAEHLIDGSLSRKKAKSKGTLDMIAAQVILQDALDSL